MNNQSCRWVRGFPGRMRVYVRGLRGNPCAERFLIEEVIELPGIVKAAACSQTGRLLIQYQPERITPEQLLQCIHQFECMIEQQEVAATVESVAETDGVEQIHTACWHAQPSRQILEQMQTDASSGLSTPQVRLLKDRYGLNQLQSKAGTPWMVSIAEQFKEFTTVILLGASVLSVMTGGLVDGLAMGAIVVLNAVIGAVQEQKAEKVVLSLNQFQPPMCKVIRDGQERIVSGIELVPGDVVLFEAGDRVPADIRLIEAWNLEVNEAALTGESVPVEKTTAQVQVDSPLAERRNMLYMGTSVTRGKALGVVVETGMNTEIGRLMALIKHGEKEITPLQNQVTSISKTFFKFAMAAGAAVFVTGLLRGIPLFQMITTSITLAASAVPQGLPIVITIALSAGIFRMAEKQVLIRKLAALETLGRVTVICSDKTGTLTKNEMTVRKVSTPNHTWIVTGNGYDPEGKVLPEEDEAASASTAPVVTSTAERDPIANEELKRLLQISLLCNNSKLEELDGVWTVKGDPTEGALLCLVSKAGILDFDLDRWSRCHEVPFDSNTGTMSVVCIDSKQNDECYLMAKGSVEAILRQCDYYQEDGKQYPLTEDYKELILQKNERYAQDALRVLAFAYRPIAWNGDASEVDQGGLVYVGMVGMMDPPKPDVEEDIRAAYQLGTKPVMITGDHPITAIAIARQLGIGGDKLSVLTGPEIERLSDDELVQNVQNVSIFARVTPVDKQRIVVAFQRLGHYVAMTGDGVNDSPAIKKANVGIAMGKTGTEVTKETSDMILKEDHFGSIVDGVKEGRTIIGNIRRAVGCLLTGNLAEVLVTAGAVLAGLPIPLVPIQILLMNLLTDAVPATVLGMNPGNKRKLTERQDIVDQELYRKVVSRGVLLGAGSLALFAYMLTTGATLAVAQTMSFATLVAGQLMQTLSWRQEGSKEKIGDWSKDRFFVSALAVSWLALLAVIYVPPLAVVFHTAPLALHHWLAILTVSSSISFLAEPIQRIWSNKTTLRRQMDKGMQAAMAV
jgi:P-type Ca2+ transporter type 2C